MKVCWPSGRGQVFIPRPALCRVSVLRGLQSFLNLHAVSLCLQFKIWLVRGDGGLELLVNAGMKNLFRAWAVGGWVFWPVTSGNSDSQNLHFTLNVLIPKRLE